LPSSRFTLTVVILLTAFARPASGQQAAQPPDSARAEIRSVLRAFYLHLQNQNWEALSAYVLSPKLLERRGAPGDDQMVARDRTRGRGGSTVTAVRRTCPSRAAPVVDEATIQLDGDWAEVSVPRCSGPTAGVDQFGMLYFEKRWRFIYTDLFQGPRTTETAEAVSPAPAE